MKKLNGIETAARLRAINPTAQIIFLTVSKEHVFEALDVMPLHYLLKQDMRTEKIEKVFLKAVSLAEKGRKEKFTYKFGKTIGSLLLSDIIYFEVKNRISITTGTTYLIITRYSFALVKRSPFFSTSPTIQSGPITQPIRILVSKEINGIRKLLLI